jgi:redox-sensitive bicupin YhaK (pirin superfamily)
MHTDIILQRSIEEKWERIPQVNSDKHKAWAIIPPGNWQRFDPFLGMMEDDMKNGVFAPHPHRGIETVSYVISGELHHQDNMGNSGNLRSGDTQWMTAGRGVLHIEEAPVNSSVNLLQLWVNLPADKKWTDPYYQDILLSDTPVREEGGVRYRVISGASGSVRSSTRNQAPVIMVEMTVPAGHTARQHMEKDFNGFIYILEGAGRFGANGVEGSKNEVLWLGASIDNASEITIRATKDLKLVLYAGRPLREPVVAQGPFVMNTEQQIREAFEDFKAGKFGTWET